jgi:hypothetical protein
LAEGLYEQIENLLTHGLSDLGKFDAEQRERLREFTAEVMRRAEEEASRVNGPVGTGGTAAGSADLQEIIDDLRAEIAELRSELQCYRNRA